MSRNEQPKSNAEARHSPADSSSPRELRSEELLAGATEVQILHRGETYRLRETRNGKLILIK